MGRIKKAVPFNKNGSYLKVFFNYSENGPIQEFDIGQQDLELRTIEDFDTVDVNERQSCFTS